MGIANQIKCFYIDHDSYMSFCKFGNVGNRVSAINTKLPIMGMLASKVFSCLQWGST